MIGGLRNLLRSAVVGSVAALVVAASVAAADAQCMPSMTSRAAIVQMDAPAPAGPVSAALLSGSVRGAAQTGGEERWLLTVLEPARCIMLGELGNPLYTGGDQTANPIAV